MSEMKTLIERLCATPEDRKLLHRETVALDVTECICKAMEEDGVSGDELARRVHGSGVDVEKLLACENSPSMEEIADIFWCLGRTVKVTAEKENRCQSE